MSSSRMPVDYNEQMRARRASLAAEASAPAVPAAPVVEAAERAYTPIGVSPTLPAEEVTLVSETQLAMQPPIVAPMAPAPQVAPATDLGRLPEGQAPGPVVKAPRLERQGIDLRPIDRERIDNFEMFCLKNKVKTGKKTGLSLYARAGLEILTTMMETDPVGFRALLVRVGEEKR